MFVWLRQSKLTLALKVAEQAGTIATLHMERARQQANLDWLMNHVNEMKLERAEILERALGIQIPVPILAREPSPPLPGADPAYRPPAPAEAPTPPLRTPQGDALNRLRDLRDAAMRGEDVTHRANALMESGLFEDMGDEEAARQGVRHTGSGEVEYTKG